MQLPGKHFLSDAGLALDQHWRFRLGYGRQELVDGAHAGAGAEVCLVQRQRRALRRRFSSRIREGVAQRPLQSLGADRLGQEIAGPGAHRLHHHSGGDVRGDSHHRQIALDSTDGAQRLQAIALSGRNIQEYGADGPAAAQILQGFLAVPDGIHGETFATQSHFQIAPRLRIVGDHQDNPAIHRCGHKLALRSCRFPACPMKYCSPAFSHFS